jgi:acyl-CoA synthetase (AMP-forming)/AMP-acid ligase II
MNSGDGDLPSKLATLAREHPSRTALIDAETGARRTYRELADRTDRVANALRELGLAPHDTIGLLMHNCIEYIEVLLGAAKLGVLTVLVNRRLSVPEMAYELESGAVRGVVYSPKFATQARALRLLRTAAWWCQANGPESTTDPASSNFEELLARAEPTFEPVRDVDLGEAGWVIINTSGTTGRPKAAVLTQGNVVAANEISHRFLFSRYGEKLRPVLRQLLILGLNHIGGLTTVTMPTLGAGGQVVILDDFDPTKSLQAIERYAPNLVFGVGTLWNSILEQDLSSYDLSSVQVVGTSVTYHTTDQLQRLHEQIDAEVYYMFGQTETTTGLVLTRRTADLWLRPRTLGVAHGPAEIRIVSESGSRAEPGEPGELQYRGPTVFKEYYGRPEETAAAFVDGWFRSGDIVRSDRDGYLYFVDRLKDVVKSGGLNVHAFEVEQTIQEHPAVADVAVAGVPDDRWGEAVTAFVVPCDDAGTSMAADEIIAFCRERLGGYKVPKRIYFVDVIPVNTLGKKLKRELVERLLAGEIV